MAFVPSLILFLGSISIFPLVHFELTFIVFADVRILHSGESHIIRNFFRLIPASFAALLRMFLFPFDPRSRFTLLVIVPCISP